MTSLARAKVAVSAKATSSAEGHLDQDETMAKRDTRQCWVAPAGWEKSNCTFGAVSAPAVAWKYG
jgi:hypothetical protein